LDDKSPYLGQKRESYRIWRLAIPGKFRNKSEKQITVFGTQIRFISFPVYVIAALLGQVKGEHEEREHLLPTASVTRSGLQVRRWIKRVIATNQVCRRVSGPAFCNDNGVVLKTSDLNAILHELLGDIFVEHSSLFQADIQSLTEIEDKYSVYRSFRRGSDSLAIAQKVPSEDIKVVNRWSKKEAAGTGKPSMEMIQSYAEIHILHLPSFMRYTRAPSLV
jgi:hypothetical protein